MRATRPAIVTTLPGRSVDAVREQIRSAETAGADLAEVRVDRLSPDQRPGLSACFPSSLPLLATYRSRAEGGEGSEDPATRHEVLRACARLPFRWIDLELRRDLALLPELPSTDRLGRIVSLHPGPSPSSQWAAHLAALASVEAIGKLVVPATLSELFETLVPLLERSRGANVVVHTTGPSGPVLRALAGRFGFPFVFASLPESPDERPVEPSQVPVDRLRPFLDAAGSPPLYGVVGRPVGHSRSPSIHSAWMRSDGRAGLFVALEPTDDGEFVRALAWLRGVGLRGINVTHPFKRAALYASTRRRPSAEACGVANCLSLREAEVLAENTDLAAIARRLRELEGAHRWSGRSLTVLGAGGAARATLAAARLLGSTATVLARRPAEARALAREFGARVAEAEPLGPAELVVQATTVGRSAAGGLDLPLGRLLGPESYVLDWVYGPDVPVVREIAQRAGATYEDGWRLFVYQAAASYALWWDADPPADAFLRAVEEGACTA